MKFPCPVCGGKKNKLLYEPWVIENDPKVLYGAATGIRGTQRLVKCDDCEMIFEDPRLSDEAIIGGYMASEEPGHDSQFPMRVESFFRALKSLGNKIPPVGSRVLDIGTAGGAFLDAATKYGYDVCGLEPSKDLVERGKKRGLKLFQGTIASNPFQDGQFDMICLWDVIEHLPQPKADLLLIRRLLKPEGILLLNYPDIGTRSARISGKKFWWLLSVHLHHFTRQTIADICRRTGYQTFHFQRYWQILQLGYLVNMAGHLGVPGAKLIYKFMPSWLRNIKVPYYASQTTALATRRELSN